MMTQVQYEKLMKEKTYIKATVIEKATGRETDETIVLPCINGGAFDPIVQYTPQRWYHLSTFISCRNSADLINRIQNTQERFKINGKVVTTGELYEQALKLHEKNN